MASVQQALYRWVSRAPGGPSPGCFVATGEGLRLRRSASRALRLLPEFPVEHPMLPPYGGLVMLVPGSARPSVRVRWVLFPMPASPLAS